MPAPFQATLDLLQDLDTTPRPADAVVSAWFRARRAIDVERRGAIIDIAYALLRHRARLGWWLARSGADDTARHRLVAWLALAGQSAGAIAKDLALSPVERALVASLKGSAVDHPDMPEDIRVECPPWAAEPLRRRFGAQFVPQLAAMLVPPPLDLRVNPVKTTRPAMLDAMRALGLPAEPMSLSPLGIRLPERLSLATLPMLKTGELEIQDEGSQLVAALVDARPGDRVVDFCAGAGGKTLAIAAQMQNRGHVVACDVSEGRLKRGAERFRRAGLHNIETRLLGSETDRWVKRHKLGFTRVLVDAPCSGTGTWRRNPDARWRPDEEQGLPALLALQARILRSAARLVRPGGRLVYSTCSLLPEENEAQVEAFLLAEPDFALVPLPVAAPALPGGTYLHLTPAEHGTDGFFAAVLERKPAAAAP